ncbi:hypothetical protein XENOCAPTIV_030501, partial [Xenoophorus captivus]
SCLVSSSAAAAPQICPSACCTAAACVCSMCRSPTACWEDLAECDDPCCNASTCQLVPGAQCSSDGICCEDCKNGEACQNSASYCYGGVCANMDTQCQMLGPVRFISPCHAFCCFRDVLCGRIQCQGGTERPLLGSIAQILTVRFNNSDLVCRGTFFHLDDDVSDPATVAQGTACGSGKVRQATKTV